MDLEVVILSELKRRNIKVKDAFGLLKMSKQTFYNRIKAAKIDEDFLTLVNNELGIDLNLILKEQAHQSDTSKTQDKNKLATALNKPYNPKGLEPLKEPLKDIIIETLAKTVEEAREREYQLKEKVNKLEEELTKYKKTEPEGGNPA